MTGRPGIARCFASAVLFGLLAGCQSPGTEAAVARGSAPGLAGDESAAVLTPPHDRNAGASLTASKGLGFAKLPRLRPPAIVREEPEEPTLPVVAETPRDTAISPSHAPIASTEEPPIRRVDPVAVQPAPRVRELPPAPDTAPAKLPPLVNTPAPPLATSDAPVGPIIVGDRPLTFESLSKMVDGQGCGPGAGGCPTCGGDCPPGRPCAAGGRKCEPYPDSHNPVKRFVGLIYQNVCCPDPCYQPRWEPLADSAFFIDAPRPINNTRVRWDYGNHLTYPDRGEFFWARADGSGKGPSATLPGVLAVPYLDYHEISVVSEIAAGGGKASVAIGVPYRTVNTTPFGNDSAGFSDMTITAKSLLVDSELFLTALQTRTYIPIGNFGKGLGVGHVSIEPGLLFGLRLTPDTYMQGQVIEWIPIAGDADYASAHLRWGASINHILWRPVKDVQLIGTVELNGISFQDGLFTDPVKGPQKLSGLNTLSFGTGGRLFFCDTFDMGVAGNFGITGKYLVRDQLRFEMRFRY